MVQAQKSMLASEVLLFPEQPALRSIYDTAPIGLACLSPDCRYLQINQRLTEICGISVENHLGRFVRDCVPALADSVAEIVRSIMETGEPVVGIEVSGQRADQVEQRYWMTYWHPLRAASGEIVAVNVAAEEITERKRAEQELREARDAAETALRRLRETQESLVEAEKLAALGRMVAGVAHEVNGPVGNSLTIASTLQRKSEAFSSEVSSGKVRRSSLSEFLNLTGDASAQLVANLSRAAERIQSFKQAALDQGQSSLSRFNAGELSKQLLSGLDRECRRLGLSLDLRFAPDLEMDSYPGPFGQVLNHLVMNAMTHAYPGNCGGRVRVDLRSAGHDHVELVVSDDGCGMAPEVKLQAFDPFFTTRRHHGATGLGLLVVYSIVTERLGGRIRLESEPGAGTSVWLTLPRCAPRPVG
ncbi:ATP-binding protein [Bradyrhizobium sp. CCGUVB1N3]|uniref:ATP-binding protein n=1 Tax=Bradyrhizobium sp. CCGUVB1N3 TaxID=2949629 RepID=UPI0020B27E76|nr:ATP-binding protein [Bradyrhizobium sp. CCGUVB1N3]MCP3469485.1 ATP-binding protein [Bradyrhizobium sp. CCGUVB1N3]